MPIRYTGRTAESRPNLIWLFPDEWRHDATGYAGNPVIHTPALDELAGRGVVFSNTTCESPLCQPSRASLLTCRFPHHHGKTHNDWDPSADADSEGGLSAAGRPVEMLHRVMPHAPFPAPLGDSILHRFRTAGYRTAEVGKMHFDPDTPLTAYGFDDVAEEHDKHLLMEPAAETGYTRYLAERGLLNTWRQHEREQTKIMMGMDPLGRAALPEALAPEDTLDAYIGRTACERIHDYAQDGQPFFLWVGFVGPHAPYDGMAPYADRYDPDTIPMGPLGFDGFTDNVWGEYSAYIAEFMNSAHYTEADYRLMAKHYYARISLIDEQIARIVAAVDQADISDNTWFVFSSDHGELLGDHGLITKAVFYETSVRVPGLLVPPRGGSPAAVRVDDVIQGIDLPATMLELAGADTSGLDGVPLTHGGTLDVPNRQAAFSEIGAFTMVATDEAKLVVSNATLEPQACYDLRADPHERHDLVAAGGHDALIDRHVSLIEEHRRD
jgi:arylsulfatase A-like enzyme